MRIRYQSAVFAIVAAATMALTPVVVYAGTTTGSLGVSTTIANNCTFGTSTMPFGTYDPVGANRTTALTVTGSVAIDCTKNDSVTLTANTGLNSVSATGSCATATCTRAMKSGSFVLSYDLYTSAADTTVWNASNTIPATGSGSAQTVSVYGYIPAGTASAAAGSYTDTVTVTATF